MPRQNDFEDYLMFSPAGGKPVPLKLATWNWYGRARRISTNSPPAFVGVTPFTNPQAAVGGTARRVNTNSPPTFVGGGTFTNQQAATGVEYFNHPEWTNSVFFMKVPESTYWQYHAYQYPTP